MFKPSELQIPPPTDWERFENMTCDLFAAKWNIEGEINGRKGQPQNGVDMYFQLKETGEWYGVQCKCKNQLVGRKITPEELKKEVEKAKQFKPKLSRFILATTSLKYSSIQEVARLLTKANRGQQLFEVRVFFWEDFLEIYDEHLDIFKEHYKLLLSVVPHLSSVEEALLKKNLTDICNQAAMKLVVQNVSIWLVDENRRLTIKVGIGYFEKLVVENASYDLGDGITGWVASGNVFRGTMEDVRKHDFFKAEHLNSSFQNQKEEPGALLMMPIYSDQMHGILGIIKVEGTRKNTHDIFDEQDERELHRFIHNHFKEIEKIFPPRYFPPIPSQLPKPAVVHNLQERRVINTFEGRNQEIEDCSALLLNSNFKLIAICGDAGIGKTTLAVRIAWVFINKAKFGGIYFVECSSSKDIDDIFNRLASSLKIEYKSTSGSEAEIFEQRKKQLQKKLEERKTLLILDNCDGLSGDKFNDLLKALLSINNLHILVTNRVPIEFLSWEKVVKLEALKIDEAVNLFIKLSRKKVTDEDKEIVRKICELVHRIPLAIELISQHTEKGFNQLSEELEKNRLSLLRADEILSKERLRDMALLLSYNHLEDIEKRLLLELSLFNGSFTQSAVDAITFQKKSYPSLQKLHEWKLVEKVSVRYYFLDTVKQFLKSKLDRGDENMGIDKDDLSIKHAHYYLKFLEKNQNIFYKIEEEKKDIYGSLDWIAEQSKRDPNARKLLVSYCCNLQEFWRIRAEWKVAKEYTKKALDAARTENDPLSELKLLNILCQVGADLGFFNETHTMFKEALNLGDKLLKVKPKNREILAIKASLLHQYGRLFDNCIYKLQKIPILKNYSDAPPPEKYFKESLRIWKKLKDKRQIARILQALGFRAMVNDDLGKAITFQKESLNIARKTRYRELEGRCLHQMGRIARKLHDLVLKEHYISQEEILGIRAQIDHEIKKGEIISDLKRADILLNSARDIAMEIGDQRAESRTRREIGTLKITLAEQEERVELWREYFKEAEKELNKALEIAQKIGELIGEEKIHEELKRLDKAKGDKK